MRARVFLRDPEFRYAAELDAADADDVWRQLQVESSAAGRSLRSGDVVYIEDRYYELNGDGGWAALIPGPLTERLYQLAAEAERGA
jgi:hypothetical protein